MKRGRPFEPGNKFGRGRPKGSPNKKKLSAEKIFDDNAAAIMALAINTARENPQLLRALLSQVGRRMGDRRVTLGNLPMRTINDLAQASELILSKIAAGKLSIGEGTAVSEMIETRRHLLMDLDMERRVSALENGFVVPKEAA